jgi:hypothetical protein
MTALARSASWLPREKLPSKCAALRTANASKKTAGN